MTFGRRMLSEWMLDPGITYLNHGTVGATPRRVLAAQQAIRDAIERQPSRALLREIVDMVDTEIHSYPKLRAAADEIGQFVGSPGRNIAFVDNATTGINAVLGSLTFEPGDEILLTDHAYGAIAYAAAFRARECGARARTIETAYLPERREEIVDAIARELGDRTRLVIVDHVSSETALIFPVMEIAARCRAAGVPVLIDGAHAPGAIPLDVPLIGADWYAANLHKWAQAPRSCGFLWAPEERQAGLHPPVISWGLDRGFTAEFDWVGTRDPSAYLAAPEGIAFMRDLDIDAMRAYNHALVLEAARMLAGRWQTPFATDERMIGCMATVPLPESLGRATPEAARLRDRLLVEDRIEIQLHAARSRLWVRISAQIYNEMDDYARLAEAVLAKR